MSVYPFVQMMSSLSGISMILMGSLWLKDYLKRSFCC